MSTSDDHSNGNETVDWQRRRTADDARPAGIEPAELAPDDAATTHVVARMSQSSDAPPGFGAPSDPARPAPSTASAWAAPSPGTLEGHPHSYTAAPAMPQPNGRRYRRWIAIAGSATAVIVVAATASAGTWYLMHKDDPSPPARSASTAVAIPPTTEATTAAPATKAQVFDPNGLSHLLLSVPEMNGLLGASTTPSQIEHAPFGYDVVTVKPIECTGAELPGMKATYLYYSENTGFVGQVLSQESPSRITAIQTATTFPTAAAAKKFLDDQSDQWQHCQDTQVTVTSTRDRESTVAAITQPATNNGVLSVRSHGISNGEHGGPAGDCDRAITTRLNVVIDVRVCAPDPATLGETLAQTLADRVTGQR